jgi:hypothetical protein
MAAKAQANNPRVMVLPYYGEQLLRGGKYTLISPTGCLMQNSVSLQNRDERLSAFPQVRERTGNLVKLLELHAAPTLA